MSETVLILSPDDELRGRLCREAASAGWRPLGFAHGESAFLCACGRVATLTTAILDEAAAHAERATLLRRLRLLRPDIRTMVLTRERGQDHGAGPGEKHPDFELPVVGRRPPEPPVIHSIG